MRGKDKGNVEREDNDKMAGLKASAHLIKITRCRDVRWRYPLRRLKNDDDSDDERDDDVDQYLT